MGMSKITMNMMKVSNDDFHDFDFTNP